MSIDTKTEDRVWQLIDGLKSGDKQTEAQCFDLLIWGLYVPEVLSQFGMQYNGSVFRQGPGACKMTVKVLDSGTPLVAFMSGQSTTSCIGLFLDALWADRVRWQKDKFPWI